MDLDGQGLKPTTPELHREIKGGQEQCFWTATEL
jgi:hypothetical protein